METMKSLLSRRSISKLTTPHPSREEMKDVYQAALRAPDHAGLRPSSFIEVTGNGLDELSKIFTKYASTYLKHETDQKLDKYKKAPYRAPMIIILICNTKDHPKVPRIEQMLSTAAAAQNILLSLHALNYGAIWRTGVFSMNEKIGTYFNLKSNQNILGYIYTGTPVGKQKKIPKIEIKDHVSKWR